MASTAATRTLGVALFCRNRGLSRNVEAIIRLEPDLRWAGTVEDVHAVLRLCESDQPDVIVLDSGSDPGWQLCLMLTGLFPRLTVVALLDEQANEPVAAAWALLHRASGIIGVDAESDRLGTAVRDSVRRGRYVDPGVEVSMNPPAQRGDLQGKPLSVRELEVLQLIADGRTAENIGHRLGISADTVRTHVYRILRKLNARDRAHAVALSFQMSLLPTRTNPSTPYRGERNE
jgi:DNA-binding NarL/FixJ family response regulator